MLPPKACTYLDVGSSYGWFVAQMEKAGFRSFGIERDPIAIEIGKVSYSIDPSRIYQDECGLFFASHNNCYDVVSCFSVLHHFVLNKGTVSATEFIGLVDRVTKRTLFLDTGQNDESWFKDSLKEWDIDFIEKWILSHTSFTRAYRLGFDQDRVPPFESNYRRMLFAFSK